MIKELTEKKNDLINELYDEKEKKVRDFVLREEETFEENVDDEAKFEDKKDEYKEIR